MFELKVEDYLAAAHNLREYQGECEALHGHNWKIEVVVRASELNSIGLAIDFKELKEALGGVLGGLDHKYLNELAPFDEINPSSENIAKYIFENVNRLISGSGATVYKVTAWESEKACASYLEG
ncbi:MAG: 6-carboxytetrahydropterin synthase QueD [Deltaproteobacteria bacterium]|nr:MAG: 6-carboxytetrahydropterin synthase QueD [Deltaproteobacteria bacterium]